MIRLISKAGRVLNPYLTRRLGVTGEQIMPVLLGENPSWGSPERSSGPETLLKWGCSLRAQNNQLGSCLRRVRRRLSSCLRAPLELTAFG